MGGGAAVHIPLQNWKRSWTEIRGPSFFFDRFLSRLPKDEINNRITGQTTNSICQGQFGLPVGLAGLLRATRFTVTDLGPMQGALREVSEIVAQVCIPVS